MSRRIWFLLNAPKSFYIGGSKLIRTPDTDTKLCTMIGFPFTRILDAFGCTLKRSLRLFFIKIVGAVLRYPLPDVAVTGSLRFSLIEIAGVVLQYSLAIGAVEGSLRFSLIKISGAVLRYSLPDNAVVQSPRFSLI